MGRRWQFGEWNLGESRGPVKFALKRVDFVTGKGVAMVCGYEGVADGEEGAQVLCF